MQALVLLPVKTGYPAYADGIVSRSPDVLLTCSHHVHIPTFVITLVLSLKEIRIELTEAPVEIQAEHLWITATEHILCEER